MSLSLPMTLLEFNTTEQLLFREVLASVSGTSVSQVNITSIIQINTSTANTSISNNVTGQTAHSRRLLDRAISVAIAISLPSAAAAAAAAAALVYPGGLNAALASVGLPPSQITSIPVIVVVNPASSSAARGAADWLALAAAAAVATLTAGTASGRRV